MYASKLDVQEQRMHLFFIFRGEKIEFHFVLPSDRFGLLFVWRLVGFIDETALLPRREFQSVLNN